MKHNATLCTGMQCVLQLFDTMRCASNTELMLETTHKQRWFNCDQLFLIYLRTKNQLALF